jgi:hypothetical protein
MIRAPLRESRPLSIRPIFYSAKTTASNSRAMAMELTVS